MEWGGFQSRAATDRGYFDNKKRWRWFEATQYADPVWQTFNRTRVTVLLPASQISRYAITPPKFYRLTTSLAFQVHVLFACEANSTTGITDHSSGRLA